MAIEKPVGIDAAIDDAARAMTDGAPSDVLRAHVLRQIAAPIASETPPQTGELAGAAFQTALASVAAGSVSLAQRLIARASRGRRRLDRENVTQDQGFLAVKTSRVPAWRPLAAAAAVLAIVAASVVWQWAGRPDVSEPPDRSAAIDPVPEPATPAGAARAAVAPAAAREAAPEPAASRSVGRVARQSPGPAAAPGTVDISPLAIAPVSPEEIAVDAVTALPGVDIAPIAIRPIAIVQVAGDQVE